jgi:hypothetical protein
MITTKPEVRQPVNWPRFEFGTSRIKRGNLTPRQQRFVGILTVVIFWMESRKYRQSL